MSESIKGYKVFNPDWTCRNFQYEVGKTFEEDVTPKCCDRGFHFCTKASDCFSYYGFNPENKVAEVLALGTVDTESDDTKCCTNKIQIVREISWQELLTIVNTGDCNTGDWNLSSFNTGCFMTEEQKIMLFDKPTDWTYRDWINSDARYALTNIPKNVVEWVSSYDMTDEEKEKYPTYETTGGYLKVLDESESAQIWWDGLTDGSKDIIKSLPNFDAEIFRKCTGIKVESEDKSNE